MTLFYVGLGLFFVPHFYSAFRSREPGKDLRLKLGDLPFMGLYSIVSLAGFVLMIMGYQQSPAGEVLYALPFDARHILALVNLVAFVLLIAAYVPKNRIQRALKHPMLLAIILWSGSHLLMPTDLKELALFGSFLAYGLIDAVRAYGRPSKDGGQPSAVSDAIVVIVGLGAYFGFAVWGHEVLIGLAPLG